MNKNKLKERALNAFDAKFRDKLCNSVQLHLLQGWKLTSAVNGGKKCKCPEGCLTRYRYPSSIYMKLYYGFKQEQHSSFQLAFDMEVDNGTPEAALGLLYREVNLKLN